MDLAGKVLAFLFVLGVLVAFHELGHYVVARWCGVKVLRFSFGFGRVLWSRRYGADGTEWAISAIPLGGYVKMADEREGDVAPADLPRAFNRQGVWRRIAIVVAGPVANLLLAVLLFAGTYVAGVPGQRAIVAAPPAGSAAAAAGIRDGDLVTAVDGGTVASWQDLRWGLLRASGAPDAVVTLTRGDGSQASVVVPLAAVQPAEWEGNFMAVLGFKADFGPPLIDDVIAGKPAALAGLRAGDRILAIDGVPMRSPADVAAATNAKPGAEVSFAVERAGDRVETTFVTEVGERAGRRIGQAGIRLKVDPVVAAQRTITVRYGIVDALAAGTRKTVELAGFTLRMLGRIVVGDASVKNISGPITMADFAGQSAEAGALVFVGYLALISISLGVLNLLPVPLLDGGHLLYYLAELIKGSPVSDRTFEVGQRIGMAVLAMLMALAFFNDLSRLF